MNETVKLWLLTMVNGELLMVHNDIRNNQVWQSGSSTDEEVEMFGNNIRDLEEFKSILESLKKQIEEERIYAE